MIRGKLKSRGFTLVEMLIVVAVLAALVVIALPMFSGYRARTVNATAQADLRNIKLQLEVYFADNLQYP